jgi:hypothetical protein
MSTAQLEDAAAILGPVVEDVVFVGGATIHLWITDRIAPPVRATDDVDVICEVATLAEYYRLGDRLRAQGVHEATGEAVICRWRSRDPDLTIGTVIRAATPTLMLATKLAAWHGRGHGDLLRTGTCTTSLC